MESSMPKPRDPHWILEKLPRAQGTKADNLLKLKFRGSGEPAIRNVPDFLTLNSWRPSTQSTGFTKAPRFPAGKRDAMPGPSSYFPTERYTVVPMRKKRFIPRLTDEQSWLYSSVTGFDRIKKHKQVHFKKEAEGSKSEVWRRLMARKRISRSSSIQQETVSTKHSSTEQQFPATKSDATLRPSSYITSDSNRDNAAKQTKQIVTKEDPYDTLIDLQDENIEILFSRPKSTRHQGWPYSSFSNRDRLKRHYEKWAKGFKADNLQKQRAWDLAGGGPAIQNLPDFITLNSWRHSTKHTDTGFTTAQRFPVKKQDAIPGPGSYFRSDPWVKRQWTYIPPFEWDGMQERLKLPESSRKLPPNLYNVVEKAKRMVSRRGPYDLFTGPRDGTTIKNHFSPSKPIGDHSWLFSPTSEMDRLKRPEHAHYGKWFRGKKWVKVDRFQPPPRSRLAVCDLTVYRKDSLFPAPGQYNLDFPNFKRGSVNSPPFNMSVRNARPFNYHTVAPGPGRYRIRRRKCAKNAHTNVFLSKTPQTLSLVKPKMNAF